MWWWGNANNNNNNKTKKNFRLLLGLDDVLESDLNSQKTTTFGLLIFSNFWRLSNDDDQA